MDRMLLLNFQNMYILCDIILEFAVIQKKNVLSDDCMVGEILNLSIKEKMSRVLVWGMTINKENAFKIKNA